MMWNQGSFHVLRPEDLCYALKFFSAQHGNTLILWSPLFIFTTAITVALGEHTLSYENSIIPLVYICIFSFYKLYKLIPSLQIIQCSSVTYKPNPSVTYKLKQICIQKNLYSHPFINANMRHSLEFFLGSRRMRSSTKFTFEEVMTGKFQAESYSVKWLTGNLCLKTLNHCLTFNFQANAYLFQNNNFSNLVFI